MPLWILSPFEFRKLKRSCAKRETTTQPPRRRPNSERQRRVAVTPTWQPAIRPIDRQPPVWPRSHPAATTPRCAILSSSSLTPLPGRLDLLIRCPRIGPWEAGGLCFRLIGRGRWRRRRGGRGRWAWRRRCVWWRRRRGRRRAQPRRREWVRWRWSCRGRTRPSGRWSGGRTRASPASSCSSPGSCPGSHWGSCRSASSSWRSSNAAAPTPRRLRLVRSETLSIPCCYLVVLDLVAVLWAGLFYWQWDHTVVACYIREWGWERHILYRIYSQVSLQFWILESLWCMVWLLS